MVQQQTPQDPVTEPAKETPSEALRLHLSELLEYAGYLLSLKIARVQHRVREVGLTLLLAAFGGVIAVAVTVTGVVLVLVGSANLIASVSGRQWLGELVVGVGVIAALVLVVLYGIKRIRRKAYEKTRATFESRKEKQRVRFNRDAEAAALEQLRGRIPVRGDKASPSRSSHSGNGYPPRPAPDA